MLNYVERPYHNSNYWVQPQRLSVHQLWKWFDKSERFLIQSSSGRYSSTDRNVVKSHYGLKENKDKWKVIESVEEVIRKGIDFVYPLLSKEPPHTAPPDIEFVLKDFSDEMIDAINSGQCNLVINDAREGYPWLAEDVNEFHLLLMQYNIDITKVIVLTASWSYVYHTMPFRMVYFPYFECLTRVESIDTDILRLPDAKKFLFLSRNTQASRFEFLFQMHSNNLLKEFNYSYQSKVEGFENNGKSNIYISHDFDYYKNFEVVNHLYPFKWGSDHVEFAKKTPFFYDTLVTIGQQPSSSLLELEQSSRSSSTVEENPLQHREENYIYVVGETVFDDGGGYSGFLPNMKGGGHRDVSEKTWKPIGLKMPFILLNQPYALKRLRDIGYRTFHTIWDESYDDICDVEERMKAIVDLIISLNNRKDFIEMINSCDEIVEHNFKMLKLRRPEMHMVKELSTFIKR